jgi:hypothetical protein
MSCGVMSRIPQNGITCVKIRCAPELSKTGKTGRTKEKFTLWTIGGCSVDERRECRSETQFFGGHRPPLQRVFDQLRCVIQHDPPAFRQLAKEQGKFAMRLIVLALQAPAPEHDCRIVAKRGNG